MTLADIGWLCKTSAAQDQTSAEVDAELISELQRERGMSEAEARTAVAKARASAGRHRFRQGLVSVAAVAPLAVLGAYAVNVAVKAGRRASGTPVPSASAMGAQAKKPLIPDNSAWNLFDPLLTLRDADKARRAASLGRKATLGAVGKALAVVDVARGSFGFGEGLVTADDVARTYAGDNWYRRLFRASDMYEGGKAVGAGAVIGATGIAEAAKSPEAARGFAKGFWDYYLHPSRRIEF